MALLCGVLMTGAAQAQNNITPALVAESAAPGAGTRVTLAIVMRPKPGWHGYWKTPGDAGFPNEFDWTLPKGAEVAALRYPVPKQLLQGELMNHIYEGEYALLTTLNVPSGLAVGTRLPVSIKARWLACTDRICVPEEGAFGTELIVGNGTARAEATARFDGWRQKLARPLGSPARYQADTAGLRLAIPLTASVDVSKAWFFAETENALSFNAPQRVSRSGDAVIVEAQKAEFGFVAPAPLKGVLALADGTGLEVEALPGVVAAPRGSDWLTLLAALGGAVLGGLLLNVMPCVFPIISLKAMSLAKAGGDAREARSDALAYTAGVVLTCLALGGGLLALRAGGSAVGWAFQLQDPRVIAVLLILTVAITLNLLGVFELTGFGGGEKLVARGGKAGAFWTGALAAFVATPCTGPFMAAALGAALVLPTGAALAIFAGLGLGMALPFLAIGFVPSLRSRLPRPGPWMNRFRVWMAVPMALTAVALLWLLWRQAGGAGLGIGLAVAVVIGALFWLSGRAQRSDRAVTPIWVGIAAASAIALVAIPTNTPNSSRATAGTVPFSEAALNKVRAEGRPVFLYFTADWCVSCKVNEAAAIDRAEVAAHFKAQNAVIMIGDWTNGDPVIGRFLEAQGRSGVPLYLWYPKGIGEPQVLPQLLTSGALTALK